MTSSSVASRISSLTLVSLFAKEEAEEVGEGEGGEEEEGEGE